MAGWGWVVFFGVGGGSGWGWGGGGVQGESEAKVAAWLIAFNLLIAQHSDGTRSFVFLSIFLFIFFLFVPQ